MNLSFLLLLSLWIPLTQTPAPSNTPDPIYTQLREPKMSGETASVSGLTIRRDAATFVFNRGEFHFAEPVQGKVVAAVFIGDGEFRIQPPTDVEKHNLVILAKQTSLVEPFSELVLHFTDNTYEEITRGISVDKKSPNPKALSILRDRMKLSSGKRSFTYPNIAIALVYSNIPGRLLADASDPSHAGFFNAFIRGKKFEHLMFRIDPRGIPFVQPEEVVLVNFSDSDLGIWNSFHLQEHYGADGIAHVADEDSLLMDIQHQEINATIKGTELRARVRTTVDVRADGPRVLGFDLFPTLRVSRVADGNGKPLQFIQGGKEEDSDLRVIFPEALQRGTQIIEFEYAGEEAIEQFGAGNFSLVARENWHPSSTFGDRATYDMTFRTPKDLVLVASGQPQGSSEIGGQVVTQWKSDIPLAVAGFNFGKFKKTELKDDKLKYQIESYANTKLSDLFREVKDYFIANFDTTRLMDKARNEAQVAMGIYQDYFGQLPYGRVAMTQQPYLHFGQAWPMLVYMPVTSYLDATTLNSIGIDDPHDFFKIVAPHEVAHQWWGHILGWKSYRDQWMSEGFSEFSASLYAHLVYGDEKFLEFWKEQRQRILEKNHMGWRPADVAPVTLGYRADNSRTGNVTRNLIYPKGAFILHMIRMMMHDNKTGDERFKVMMRDFIKTHFNQNVSTEDFKRIVEKHMTAEMDIAGNKMDWFFNQYVYGTDIPRYKLDYQLEASGRQTILKMRLTQSEVSANFRMAVPVYLELEDMKLAKLGAVRILGNSTQEATVSLGFRPRRVLLAAYEDVLANIDQR